MNLCPEAAQTMLTNAIEKNDEQKIAQTEEKVKEAEEKVKEAKEEVKQAEEKVKAIRCTVCSQLFERCKMASRMVLAPLIPCSAPPIHELEPSVFLHCPCPGFRPNAKTEEIQGSIL